MPQKQAGKKDSDIVKKNEKKHKWLYGSMRMVFDILVSKNKVIKVLLFLTNSKILCYYKLHN